MSDYIYSCGLWRNHSAFLSLFSLVNAERAAIAALSVYLTCFFLISCINAASSSDLVIVAT